MTLNLKEKYIKEVIPALQKEFGYKNKLAVPKIEKIVINTGLGKALQDKQLFEVAEDVLARITGQKAVRTKAKKSISNFKIRQGMDIGLKATLRGQRMYDFLTKLVYISFPRVRDFRGISARSFDGCGNYAVGMKEQIVFPEIKHDEIEKIFGLEIVIATSAKDDKEGYRLLKLLGFPFKDEIKTV